MNLLPLLTILLVDCILLWEPLLSGTYARRETLIVL